MVSIAFNERCGMEMGAIEVSLRRRYATIQGDALDVSPSGLSRPAAARFSTAAGSPVRGGNAHLRMGLAALGGAAALPAMLLAYVGAVGVTTLLDALVKGGDGASQPPAGKIRLRAEPHGRVAVRAVPTAAARVEPFIRCEREEEDLRRSLLNMDPFDFERHVMSFFARDGMESWVTGKAHDRGVDGFARHPRGLVVVQCKRNGVGNLVGRPVVQQMRGVVAEYNAVRGYLVTTSRFSDKARHSARLSDQVELVDMRELLRWHREPPSFCF